MAVLMGSGMTVEQTWNRITARYLDERKNNDKNIMPAYEEMLVTEREISDGVIRQKSIRRFCGKSKAAMLSEACTHYFTEYSQRK